MTIFDGDVTVGWLRDRKLLKSLLNRDNLDLNTLPQMARNYALRMSKITGKSVEEILRSEPFRKFLEKLTS